MERPGPAAAKARPTLRGRRGLAERSPRCSCSPQAILAAQRRGEDVETSKKCGYPAAGAPRGGGGGPGPARPGGRRSPAAVRARPAEPLPGAFAWSEGGGRHPQLSGGGAGSGRQPGGAGSGPGRRRAPSPPPVAGLQFWVAQSRARAGLGGRSESK